MHAGVLVVGSLLWEGDTRQTWRECRLDVGNMVQVQVPIGYRRLSRKRNLTYTMTFNRQNPDGKAWLIPYKVEIEHVEGLIRQAQRLWTVEALAPGGIGADWGCAGAMFNPEFDSATVASEWSEYFRRSKTNPVDPVDDHGVLSIPWPEPVVGGTSISGIDVLLATATKSVPTVPSAVQIADAWLTRPGRNEYYFFNNVRDGIRTPDDLKIWRQIEGHQPAWIGDGAYADAIRILKTEAGAAL